MKYCSYCGKQLLDEAAFCVACGRAVGSNEVKNEKTNIEAEKKEVSYDDCVKCAVTTNIISAIVIMIGVACWLFVSIFIGALLCLVAEFIALYPNTKVQNAFKQNGITGNSKEMKAKRKAIMKDLRGKSIAYSFSMVLAIISLVLLVFFLMFF